MTANTRSNHPILVTGSNRSGTTWVGDMLCRAPETVYLHEPFNPQVRPQWFSGLPFERTQFIDDTNSDIYSERLERLVGARPPWLALVRDAVNKPSSARNLAHLASVRRRVAKGHRLVIKDPIAVFSSLHMAKAHQVAVVVCVRPPVAYAGSLKRMQWRFDFGSWARQSNFLAGPAEPYASEIAAAAENRPDIVDTAILRWNVTYAILNKWRMANPSWIVVEHTALARDFVPGFADLYERLGLDYTEAARDQIASANAPSNSAAVADRDRGGTVRDAAATVDTWQTRLDEAEVERVRTGTAEVAALYEDVGSGSW